MFLAYTPSDEKSTAILNLVPVEVCLLLFFLLAFYLWLCIS
jgi:hypothetical protein